MCAQEYSHWEKISFPGSTIPAGEQREQSSLLSPVGESGKFRGSQNEQTVGTGGGLEMLCDRGSDLCPVPPRGGASFSCPKMTHTDCQLDSI